MNSTEIYQAKRDILNFSEFLSIGLSKPEKNFISDMIFGLSKGCKPILSEIARSLSEDISPAYTIKRLSRQAGQFSGFSTLQKNYLKKVKQILTDDMLVIVDGSDIIKPNASKLEYLSKVRDGSTGKFENGFSSENIIITSPKTKHPIPIYCDLFSSKEEDFISKNVKTYSGLQNVKQLFGDKSYTLVFDRGYDANDLVEFVVNQEANFILRLKDNRYLLHNQKRIKATEIADNRKGKINLNSTIKGKTYKLKISQANVELPCLEGIPMNLIIVYGYGKSPMKLLTNKPINGKNDVLSIVKGYIARWRIEENFRVQKQEYNLEEVRTINFNATKLFYQLISYLIGHHSLVLDEDSMYSKIVTANAKATIPEDKIRFYLYRFIRGLAALLKFDETGNQSRKNKASSSKYMQLSLDL